MKSIIEILGQYTAGKATLEETNADLKEAGAEFHLDPRKNELTPEEIAQGYGLLDTGTGSFDKVQVKDGQLMNCDCGEMAAFVLLEGKYYPVYGTRVALEEGKDGIVDKATDESAEH